MYINRQNISHQEDSQFTIAKEIVQGSKKRNMYRQGAFIFLLHPGKSLSSSNFSSLVYSQSFTLPRLS